MSKTDKASPALGCIGLVRRLRPKTRGELRDALNAGQTCEVPDCGVEMTVIMLKGWLACENFTVEKSANDGWVLFLPNHRISHTEK
ncbi:MAG: hypothetical protein H7343_03710 [Undibacterium sp.]|nr:hypothetical protein [Opitutaceae bacterium]